METASATAGREVRPLGVAGGMITGVAGGLAASSHVPNPLVIRPWSHASVQMRQRTPIQPAKLLKRSLRLGREKGGAFKNALIGAHIEAPIPDASNFAITRLRASGDWATPGETKQGSLSSLSWPSFPASGKPTRSLFETAPRYGLISESSSSSSNAEHASSSSRSSAGDGSASAHTDADAAEPATAE